MSVARKIMMGVKSGPSINPINQSLQCLVTAVNNTSSSNLTTRIYRLPTNSRTSTTVWSCSIWMKRDTAGSTGYEYGASPIWAGRKTGFNTDESLFIPYQTDAGAFAHWGSNANWSEGESGTSANGLVNDTDWHHFAYYRSGATMKFYVDGTLVLTSTSSRPTEALGFNANNGIAITAGMRDTGAWNLNNTPTYDYYGFNGKIAEAIHVDGQALDASSFGATIGGSWKPIEYTGSFGNHGFHCKFASGAIGTDSSGNGNNFSLQNLTNSQVVTNDTPTT